MYIIFEQIEWRHIHSAVFTNKQAFEYKRFRNTIPSGYE